jgi:hypothetical protein
MGGGDGAHGRADGKELFYLAGPDRVMAVDVVPGDVPHFSPPHEVFRQAINSFDVSPDGQTFVALRPSDSDVSRPLTLVSNWTRLIPRQ